MLPTPDSPEPEFRMRGPLAFLAVVALGGGAALLVRGSPAEPAAPLPAAVAVSAPADASLATMTVYKSPACGCCGAWVEHMRAEGFTVEVEDVADLMAVKNRLGVPMELGTCHTAVIGDYVIEGHVPAEDVRRLLAEAPDAAGLAVPGMPTGSPGMEVPGRPADAFDVIAFGRDGSRSVFASH